MDRLGLPPERRLTKRFFRNEYATLLVLLVAILAIVASITGGKSLSVGNVKNVL